MTQKEWRELELAGLADANGDVGARVPANGIIVPEVIRLDGDALVWRLGSGDPKTHPAVVYPDHQTLNAFLQLANAAPDSFFEFARKWGVLNLNSRGLPCTGAMRQGREAIDDWRYFSKRATAILRASAYLNQGKLAPAEALDCFCLSGDGSLEQQFTALTGHWLPAHHWPPENMGRAERIATQRRIIAKELNAWLAINNEQSNLRRRPDFSVDWNRESKTWQLRIDYDGFLFRALALQLTLAVCGSRGLYLCSGCGSPYMRTLGAPRRSKNNFCEQCGRGEINRRAAQRRREKIRTAQKLHSHGVPFKKIAERLDTSVKHVTNWIKEKNK